MYNESQFKQLCRMILPKKIVYGFTYIYNLIKTEPEIRKKWKENIKYKNSHMGERCFILGNGPSLKDVSFEKLSNEFIFTVNNFSTIDNYEIINTNVHLWVDENFFCKNNPKLNLMENYKKISELKPICFVPTSTYEFFKKNKLDKILNLNYLLPRKRFTDGSVGKIELHKLLYTCGTVVQYAIQVAIYMGFSEIYLLGCDATGTILAMNNMITNQNVVTHASDKYIKEDVPEIYQETLNMPEFFYEEYIFFLGYQKLAEYCKKNRIKLRNCSSKTLINEIERGNLEDIL